MTDEAPITDAARRAPSHDAVVPGVAALVVLTPDVRELRFVAAGYSFLHGMPELPPGTSSTVFSEELPQHLVAHIVSNVAATRPHSFEYEVEGSDGVVRRVAARLVTTVGGERPLLVGVWDASVPVHRPAAVAYDHVGDVLDTFRGQIPARSLLETLLLCVAQACGADAVAVVTDHDGPAADPAGATVLAAVDLAAGDQDVADERIRDALASTVDALTELASADGLRLVARGPRRDRSLGWLGERTFRTARELLEAIDPDGVAGEEREAPAPVVYVDDDAPSRELLVEFFRLLPHLELVAVATLAEARAAIVEHRPAVVISDAWLGEESTEAFVTELLTGSQLDAPGVVVLSADANPSTIARFRRLGVGSYLSKPIHLDRLAAVVTDLANSVCSDEGNGTRARTIAASGS